jgi:hypothetical protein
LLPNLASALKVLLVILRSLFGTTIEKGKRVVLDFCDFAQKRR